MMHGRGKSDEAIVALKPANKAERSAAEQVERRAKAKGNVCQRSRAGLSTGLGVLPSLARIRTIASAMARLDPRWKPYAGKLHVRICAGGEEQSSSLPRPNEPAGAGASKRTRERDDGAACPHFAKTNPELRNKPM